MPCFANYLKNLYVLLQYTAMIHINALKQFDG